MDRLILHIVHREKFTSGYINFMKKLMPEWRHYFVTKSTGFKLELCDENNVLYLDDFKKILSHSEIASLLEEASKVIVTGIFKPLNGVYKFPKSILQKTYLHFWGGDFYCLRNRNGIYNYVRYFSRRIKIRHAMKGCAGVIMLIDSDYDQLVEITGIRKKHYIAPMPFDPLKKIDYSKYRHIEKHQNKYCRRILLGNSATKENQHVEILEMLKKLEGLENVEICCPLSYGKKKYREEVIKKGRELWNDQFNPITEYMEFDKYLSFLATCDIAIFNNNRQQAMGNIWLMLALGKKVFLRTDTPMWDNYVNKGVVIFPVEDIPALDSMALFEEDVNISCRNERLAEEHYSSEWAVKAWSDVLDDGT